MKNYKNTMQNSIALMVMGALFALAFVAMPLSVKAADLDFGGGDWITDSVTPFYDYADQGGGNWVTDSVTPYYDYGTGGGEWVTDSVTPYYDYGSSYNGGYGGSMPYFTGSGFGGGSFFTGGGYSTGYSVPSNSNVNVNTNTLSQYCTGNNVCNTDDHSIFNAPTTIVTNPAPVVINNTAPSYPSYPVYTPPSYYPSQPVCNTCGCPGYQACQRPIAYNNQPYVTLSAVPYTGLELGPVGTALYWGFLVLWCLVAAYLLAVKKIQNKVVAWITGSTPSHTAHAVHTPAHVAHAVHAAPAPKPEFAGIDSFIQSQINRAK